jgi:hypothetical protein
MIQSAKFISNAVAMARLPFLIFEDWTQPTQKSSEEKPGGSLRFISHSGRF